MVQPAVDGADEPASPAAELPASGLLPPRPPVSPRVQRPVSPGDLLLAALDACSHDAQRAALLAAASVRAREQLPAALAYREMSTLAGRNPPLGALVAALDGAADECGRAALLSATLPALLVELAEHLSTAPRQVRCHRPTLHGYAHDSVNTGSIDMDNDLKRRLASAAATDPMARDALKELEWLEARPFEEFQAYWHSRLNRPQRR